MISPQPRQTKGPRSRVPRTLPARASGSVFRVSRCHVGKKQEIYSARACFSNRPSRQAPCAWWRAVSSATQKGAWKTSNMTAGSVKNATIKGHTAQVDISRLLWLVFSSVEQLATHSPIYTADAMPHRPSSSSYSSSSRGNSIITH